MSNQAKGTLIISYEFLNLLKKVILLPLLVDILVFHMILLIVGQEL